MLVNIAHLVELNMLGPIFSKKLSDIILSFKFDGKPYPLAIKSAPSNKE